LTRDSRATAAIPERKLATCQASRSVALMAAPPVENSAAAASSSSRLDVLNLMGILQTIAPSVRDARG
jgi:hypothetical protein